MGKEQTCRAVIHGLETEGRALLETDEILFRGVPKLKLPLGDIKKVSVRANSLVLKHKGGEVSFALGAKQAAAWAQRILHPPGLLDKLGVKPGLTITIVNLDDRAFLATLASHDGEVRKGRKGKHADIVMFGAESAADLTKLAGLDKLITPAGGIWVIYPKGRKDIREADVMVTGRSLGWKDNKTCRFSDTHTGLRFVIPVAARGNSAKR